MATPSQAHSNHLEKANAYPFAWIAPTTRQPIRLARLGLRSGQFGGLDPISNDLRNGFPVVQQRKVLIQEAGDVGWE